MAAEPAGPSGDDNAFGRLIGVAGRVLASTGVLTAILYYFGYVREQALFDYFGVDLGAVGFSTTDYLVLSAGPVFSPLASLAVFSVGLLIAHHLVLQLMKRAGRRWRQAVCASLAVVGFGMLTLGAISLHRLGDALTGPYLSPALLGGGTVVLEYAAESATRYGLVRAGMAEILDGTRDLRRALLVALALVAAFWATANVAQEHGVDAARAVELSLAGRSQAVVYARERLQISGPGVEMVRLPGKDAGFRYRYNGLRTLAHVDDRWFLLPVGWTHDNGATVILLPDSKEATRVDVAP
ncbi:hypothetical protein AGRA3207_002079 [Actinomadura graeca]|uniref:Uncharacterized protein n=1 Tax=Actinomadura graeca TaxID=2750812 RepID=A0ABX8QRI4_9ACTN|nr:hypothetical protein [Actinomadura graeca]QXJ21243.1 hypothetical protein AGRA3207_002079 [Actinomadura graeca]